MIVGIAASLAPILIALKTKTLFDSAQYGQIDSLIQSGLIIIFIVLIQTLLQSFMTVFSTKTTISLSNSLRLKLFEKLSRTQWLDFTKYHTADLLTRMTSDIDTVVGGVTSVIPQIISLLFTFCASMAVMITFDPMLALFAFFLGPISIVFARLFGNKLSEYHLRIQETESSSRGFIQERLKNMHVVKSFRLEKESISFLSVLQRKKLGWVLKRSRISAVSSGFLTLGYWLGFLLAILWGSMQLSRGLITFGTITVYLQLVGQIQDPFVGLAYSVPQVIVMYASAGRLIQLYDLEEEGPTEKTGKTDKTDKSDETSEGLNWISAGIEAKELEFKYDNSAALLNNVSFDIRPGEFTAIVGASGEGKTTFIRLLLSLLKPAKGELHFYNPQIQDKVQAGVITRSLASYVPQGNTLFSGTIAENVRMGNKKASDQELSEALKCACILDFIESLPDKANTIVGENGYGLSEGQAQRICIARALLCKKPILILDEATSALDSATELEVLRSIASIKPLPTCIIITHRKAALDFCSKILTVENGTISESS